MNFMFKSVVKSSGGFGGNKEVGNFDIRKIVE